MVEQDFIGQIYEAAFIPERWPQVLDGLAQVADGRGGVFFAANTRVLNWTASASLLDTFRHYVGDGWLRRCTRRSCMLIETRPGFLIEQDVWTEDELEQNPIYRDFLRPRGLGWSAGMAIPLPTGDTVVLTVEREYAKGPVERHRVSELDRLRPHLARSALLAARLSLERASVASATLELVGLPAMVIATDGTVLAANRRTDDLASMLAWRGRDRVTLLDSAADALLWSAVLAAGGASQQPIQSFPVRGHDPQSSLVAHVVPVRGAARDVFPAYTAVVVFTPVTRPQAPALDLLRSLFDLTPAEARIAAGLTAGQSLTELASAAGVSLPTVRTQLRGVMEKTGCARQADLVALLSGITLDRTALT